MATRWAIGKHIKISLIHQHNVNAGRGVKEKSKRMDVYLN
jgi:hypothetical protein